jgi:PKD repeat protein
MKKTLLSITCLAALLFANKLNAQLFSPATQYGACPQPYELTSADFNGDGKADLATANGFTGDVSVLLGSGTGTFTTPVNYAVGGQPRGITSADFNGDGFKDLAVATGTAVSILLGSSTGTFAAAVNYAAYGCWGVTSADFNGDGKADLATSNVLPSGIISVLLGSGTGTFSAATNYAAGFNPRGITSADFNGDGFKDLATVDGLNNVSVLFGSGTGTFAGAVNYVVAGLLSSGSPSFYNVTSADFNGDGKADLALAHYFSNNVSVLLNSGTGTFPVTVNYPVGTNPRDLTTADFNGDGFKDLAVGNGNSNSVSVLLGSATGTFAAAVNYSVGTQPGGITSADFNGDCKPDLATANEGSNNVSVLLNINIGGPVANFSGTPTTICAGSSVTFTDLSTNTPTSWYWTLPGGTPAVSTLQNSAVVYNTPGTYNVTLTATSSAGCSKSLTLPGYITVHALPIVSATTSNILLCTGNTASLTASGAASYVWNTSATTPVIAVSPTVTTTYTVTGVNANGCSNSSIITQSVSTCTGLELLASPSADIFMYPNPSNGSFKIELTSVAKVSISNVIGQVIMNTSMLAGTHTIVLNDVTDGIYFVKVISGNTQTIKRLLVSK